MLPSLSSGSQPPGVLCTSNKSSPENFPSPCCIDSKMFDNVALMLLKLLIKINIKSVSIAGLDGFSPIATENYVSENLINNAKVSEFDERNDIMSEEISKFSEKIDINFITPTLYKIKQTIL